MKYFPNLTEEDIRDNRTVFEERYNVYKKHGLDFFKSRENLLAKSGGFGEKILDIGSGRGITVIALARLGYEVTTIDNSEDMLKTAALNLAGRELLSKVELYKMDAYSLEFHSESFDTIFSVEALHHLDDVEAFLSQADRVLSPEGKIILADFNEKGRRIIDAVHGSEGRTHAWSSSEKGDAIKWLNEKSYDVEDYDDICHWVVVAKKGRMNMDKRTVSINEELCIGCGLCVNLCPMDILYVDKSTNKCSVTDHAKCDKLKGCERICPVNAIKIN